MAWPCRPCSPSLLSLHHQPWPPCQFSPPHPTAPIYTRPCRGGRRQPPHDARPGRPGHAADVAAVHVRAPLDTRRATTSVTPCTSSRRREHHHATTDAPDTRATTTRARRRRRQGRNPALAAPVRAIARPSYASPYHAINAPRTAMTSPTYCAPSSLLRRCGPTTSPLTSPTPHSTPGIYK
jgi:hypothetical protein